MDSSMSLPHFRDDEPPDYESMRRAGEIAARAHEAIRDHIGPGRDGEALERRAVEVIREAGAEPAFYDYSDGNHAITVSINDELIHAPPDSRTFEVGDLVSVDLGARFEGHYSDTAMTHIVGDAPDSEHFDLIDRVKTGLYAGIQRAVAGNTLRDVGEAIEQASGPFGNVTGWAGHFIGRRLHYQPQVFSTAEQNDNVTLETGMCLAIEPIYTLDSEPETLETSGGAVRTKSGRAGAHFEHTVWVHRDRVEVLTARDDEPDFI